MAFIVPPKYEIDLTKIVHETDEYLYLLCPFHTDSRPSIAVHKTGYLRGKWRCYSCRASGILSPEQMSQIGLVALPEHYIEPPDIDWEGYIKRCRLSVEVCNKDWAELLKLAQEFNVESCVLDSFRVGWNGWAWVMPMKKPTGEMIGVSQRFQNGEKNCVHGSKLGLFFPEHFWPEKYLFVCEGFSDTACVTDLGLSAIGRANADSCESFVKDFVILNQVEKVVIIGDNDKAGIRGAENLKRYLTSISQCDMIIPEIGKDVREQIQRQDKEKVKQFLEDMM